MMTKNAPQRFTSGIGYLEENYTIPMGIEYTDRIKRTQRGEFLLWKF